MLCSITDYQYIQYSLLISNLFSGIVLVAGFVDVFFAVFPVVTDVILKCKGGPVQTLRPLLILIISM